MRAAGKPDRQRGRLPLVLAARRRRNPETDSEDGNLISGTKDDGAGYNSRVTFRPTEAGTYYVSAGAYDYLQGTYTLSMEEVTDSL